MHLQIFDPAPKRLGIRTNWFRRLHRKIVVVDGTDRVRRRDQLFRRSSGRFRPRGQTGLFRRSTRPGRGRYPSLRPAAMRSPGARQILVATPSAAAFGTGLHRSRWPGAAGVPRQRGTPDRHRGGLPPGVAPGAAPGGDRQRLLLSRLSACCARSATRPAEASMCG